MGSCPQPQAGSHPPHLDTGERWAGGRSGPRSPPTGVYYPPPVHRWGHVQDRLHWAFAFPGSTSRCHWLRSLHCLEKGKVLQRGREEISWQENTRLAFCRECVFVGGSEKDVKSDIPTQEILPSTSGWQNSVLPPLLQSLQLELVFATDYKAREGKEGILSRRAYCPKAGSAARLSLTTF